MILGWGVSAPGVLEKAGIRLVDVEERAGPGSRQLKNLEVEYMGLALSSGLRGRSDGLVIEREPGQQDLLLARLTMLDHGCYH